MVNTKKKMMPTKQKKKSGSPTKKDRDVKDDEVFDYLFPAIKRLFGEAEPPANQVSEICTANLNMHYDLFTAEFGEDCRIRPIILIKPSRTMH